MAESKKTFVTLQVGDMEWLQDFEIAHAERLLAMPNNGGWHLPDGSKYQYDKKNGLIKKRTPKENTGE